MSDPDRFQKNMARWALFCPHAAAKLAETDASAVTLSEDGFMQIADGENIFPCEDRQNPIEEARRVLDHVSLRDINILYVYGVGGGFMYDALKDWLKESILNQIVFLESDLRVIKRLLDSHKGSEILFDPQVWLYHLDSEDRTIEAVTTLFILKPWDFLVLDRYVERAPQSIQQVRARLSFFSNLKYNSTYEYVHFGWGYFQNFFKNVFSLPDAFQSKKMYGRFHNVPAIICGAGPSMKKNRHILEKLKDRALIFAGGTAMNAINVDGFTPHFGIGIDPNIDQFTRLITNTAFETPYFYRNRLLNDGLNLIHGDHIYVSGSGGYGITRWLESELDIYGKDISEGCNVINFSLSIAAEMGCNPIIFVGVDLAYSDEESYAPGILNHPVHNRREFFKTKNSQEELIVKPDIYGNAVYTLWKWIMESMWFTTFAINHPGLTLINATEGGLGFKGVPNMPLQEAVDQHLTKQFDFSGFVHAAVQQSRMPQEVTRQAIAALFDKMALSLEKCTALFTEVHQEITRLAKDHLKGLPVPKELLTEKAKKALQDLELEVAYTDFLKIFSDTFKKVFEQDNLRLSIDKDILGPEKVIEKKLILQASHYKMLIETSKANCKLLRDAQEKGALNTELLEVLEAAHQPISQPEEPKNDASIETSALNIQKHTRCNSNERVISEYYELDGALHGPFLHYDDEGHLLAKTPFIHGKREGHSIHYYPNGNIAAILFYKNGLQEASQKFYFPNGVLRADIHYSEGLLNGTVHLYDKFGRLCREITFQKGKREGQERIWNAEGLLIIEASFKNNHPVERARKWYSNGNLALETIFDETGRVLSSRKWDVSGAPVFEDANNDDYFDKVTKQTGELTTSLNDIVSQITNFAPILSDALTAQGSPNNLNDIQKDIDNLKKGVEELKEYNRKLLHEAGLDPEDHKEPLWKSPSTKRELELHVEKHANKMGEELINMQLSLAQTIQGLLLKIDKNKDKTKDKDPGS